MVYVATARPGLKAIKNRIMKYNSKITGKILVLYFNGDLIGENKGTELMELINDRINDGLSLCAIDISEVRFINSSGIGVLITILTKFRNKSGEVVLIRPSEQVRKLLIITKLTAIFTVVESEEEAIEKLLKTEQE
jgi:anti-sigma B factor antagonist